MKNKPVLLVSSPRSGSTWLTTRVAKLFNITPIHEPLRVLFGAKQESPLHHSKALSKNLATDASFWAEINQFDVKRYQYLMQWIAASDHHLLKETSGLLQLDFLKEIIPNLEIVILLRNPLAVFDSHIRINNVLRSGIMNHVLLTFGQDLKR